MKKNINLIVALAGIAITSITKSPEMPDEYLVAMTYVDNTPPLVRYEIINLASFLYRDTTANLEPTPSALDDYFDELVDSFSSDNFVLGDESITIDFRHNSSYDAMELLFRPSD